MSWDIAKEREEMANAERELEDLKASMKGRRKMNQEAVKQRLTEIREIISSGLYGVIDDALYGVKINNKQYVINCIDSATLVLWRCSR